jgi:hypothetical protein
MADLDSLGSTGFDSDEIASVFDLLNKSYEQQEQAMKKLLSLGLSYAEIESKTKIKHLQAHAKLEEDIAEGRKARLKKEEEMWLASTDTIATAQQIANDRVAEERKKSEDELEKQRKEKIISNAELEIAEIGRVERFKAEFAAATIENEKKLNENFLKYRDDKIKAALKKEAAARGVLLEELNEDEIAEIEKTAKKGLLTKEKYEEVQRKKALQEQKKELAQAGLDAANANETRFQNAFAPAGKNETFEERKERFKALYTNEETGEFDKSVLANSIVGGLASLAQKLENKMDESGKHQTGIDTRLYGSSSNDQALGSYWRSLSADIMSIAGASPLILQTDMIASLEKLVGSGISHNVKLRAFLDTITDKIATTFEVNDSTMLRLIRMQQQDTTAARLGMESALNAFLNNMFETTEYLSKLADTVRGNLEEAQALMGAKQATEFEYQVQKWMGSMYSVGMSDSTVTNIATTLGQLAAGEIEALTQGQTGNLMIMAANSAGLSIADILKDGLDAETTNKLMEATVNYLAQIAQQTDSKVIQQQLAGVFGMKASDLQSIMNLVADNSKTVKNIATTNLTNELMMAELVTRAATMTARVSIGEMMTNVWENVQYSMAAGMANNPATYLLYKVAGLLQQAVGGIPISFLNVYGFGVDLNTSVAQLMQAGAMAGGILGSMGSMLGALGNMVGGGATMLLTAGLATQGKTISRGNGAVGANALAKSGASTSSSGLVGNASSSDMQGATMSDGQDDKDSQGAQGKEENEDATRDDIIEILKMLFGMIGKKIDENTDAVKGTGGVFNSNDSTMGGFTNAATTKNSGW